MVEAKCETRIVSLVARGLKIFAENRIGYSLSYRDFRFVGDYVLPSDELCVYRVRFLIARVGKFERITPRSHLEFLLELLAYSKNFLFHKIPFLNLACEIAASWNFSSACVYLHCRSGLF